METQNTREYDERKFEESFRRAMAREESALEQKRRRGQMKNRHTIDVFKDNGTWKVEWISAQYCLIAGGLSNLPSTQRQYLSNLGKVASKEYEKL